MRLSTDHLLHDVSAEVRISANMLLGDDDFMEESTSLEPLTAVLDTEGTSECSACERRGATVKVCSRYTFAQTWRTDSFLHIPPFIARLFKPIGTQMKVNTALGLMLRVCPVVNPVSQSRNSCMKPFLSF